jgi:hypothetical protein
MYRLTNLLRRSPIANVNFILAFLVVSRYERTKKKEGRNLGQDRVH